MGTRNLKKKKIKEISVQTKNGIQGQMFSAREYSQIKSSICIVDLAKFDFKSLNLL